MGKESKIAWCDNTQNWWIGCEELPGRPGCAFCYAHAQGKRCGWDAWGKYRTRMITSAHNWNQPAKWDAKARAENRVERVFCMSLGDFLDDRPELVEPRKRACEIMVSTTSLEWLILTKRIDNVGLLPDGFLEACRCRVGITVENQQIADRDVIKLLRLDVPNFISVEPMLGPVVFEPWDLNGCRNPEWSCAGRTCPEACRKIGDYQGIDWVIVGAESRGKNAGRHFDPQWARALRDQCVDAGVPFFFKQGHLDGRTIEMPELDGRVWNQMPEHVRKT